jgi:hypothetical protein
MGGSIPGKVFEQVNYAGGEPAYAQEIRSVLPSFHGFDIVNSSRETDQVSSKI